LEQKSLEEAPIQGEWVQWLGGGSRGWTPVCILILYSVTPNWVLLLTIFRQAN